MNLVGKPSQMTVFDALYSIAARDGRGEALFGNSFGYQEMLDWFSGICDRGVNASCGIELDTSVGETERAGVYLQYRKNTDLIAPFLGTVGEEARAESFLAVADRMPEGWPPAYVGLFPGRAGTPLRIGGYLEDTIQKACAEDPSLLAAQFDHIGFAAYDEKMLLRCSTFLSLAPSIDFQFDIMPLHGHRGRASSPP